MRTLVLLSCLSLAACVGAGDAELRSLPLFGGYRVMEIPKADVPLGARWIDGYGPAGEGVRPEDVVVESGIASLDSSNGRERSASLRIEPVASAASASRNSMAAELSEVAIHRVKDVAALGLRPGESWLYEAIKAGEVNVQVGQSGTGDVALGVRGFPLDVAAEADGASQRSVTVQGTNLFVAYRVIRAEPVRAKKERSRFVRVPNGFSAAAGGYTASIVGQSCSCSAAEAECNLPQLVVARSASPGIGAEELRFSLSDQRRQSFALPPGSQRPARDGPYLDLTELVLELRKHQRPSAGADTGESCLPGTLEPANLEVTRTTVQLRHVTAPSAPDW